MSDTMVEQQLTSFVNLSYSPIFEDAPAPGHHYVIDSITVGPQHGNKTASGRFDVRIMSKSGSVYTAETCWFRSLLQNGQVTHSFPQGIACASGKALVAQMQSAVGTGVNVALTYHDEAD